MIKIGEVYYNEKHITSVERHMTQKLMGVSREVIRIGLPVVRDTITGAIGPGFITTDFTPSLWDRLTASE